MDTEAKRIVNGTTFRVVIHRGGDYAIQAKPEGSNSYYQTMLVTRTRQEAVDEMNRFCDRKEQEPKQHYPVTDARSNV